MIVFNKYKAEVKKHIQNKDLFLVKSLIRDDDTSIPKRMMQKITMGTDNIECFYAGKIDNFNKSVCRHRYSYVCELIDFYDPEPELEYPYFFCLKIKIVNVIDNPMNVPQIKENNIIRIYVSPQAMGSNPPDVAYYFSIFYKTIDNENQIYNNLGEYNHLLPSKGFFYLEMKRYEPESS